MITIHEHEISPTIFPDGTSQVWHLPKELEHIRGTTVNVVWTFENEAEFMHILQLSDLLKNCFEVKVNLTMPYLPYARQDKDISNEETFALRTLLKTLKLFVDNISVFDPHSDVYKEWFEEGVAISPESSIAGARVRSNADMICYPDKGASKRYSSFLDKYNSVSMEKVRNKHTGEITGLKFSDDSVELQDKKVLIVDDLCDGGRTFIEAAKLLYTKGAYTVNLYVSHGIFSKGLDILHQNGIIKVFTKDGLVSEKVSNE